MEDRRLIIEEELDLFAMRVAIMEHLRRRRQRRRWARRVDQGLPMGPLALLGFWATLFWGLRMTMAAQNATHRPGEAGSRLTPENDDWRTVYAYDCSRPSQVESVRIPPPGACPRPDVKVTAEKDQTFSILQRAQYLRFPARSCRVWETRLPFYCGTYSHQTMIGNLVRVEQPVRVTRDVCRRMVEDGEFHYEGVMVRNIPMNQTSHRTVEVKGKTVWYTSNHINCEGTGPIPEGVDNVVDVRVLKIELSQVWLARGSEDTVIIPRTTTTLPCPFHTLGCRARDSGTFNWDPMSEAAGCYLHKVRFSRGKVYTDSDGAETFISTDKSAVRLLLGREIQQCGRPVRETEHARLYVTEALEDEHFAKELDPMELSPVLYGAVQTGYVESRLANHIETVIADLKIETCEVRSRHSSGRYDQLAATQRAALHGATAALGEGRFATAAGEAWYTYACARVLARAENLDECYGALPVSLTQDDREAHFKARGERVTFGVQFFVEPTTHRLITAAAHRHCDPTLVPLYRSAHGSWFHAGPQLNRAAAPHQLSGLSPTILSAQYNHTDLGRHGSLYTPAQVQQMDMTRQMPNLVDDIEVQMAEHATQTGWAEGSRDSLSAYDILQTSGPWYLDPLGSVWAWLNHAYYIANWVTCLGFITKFVTWAYGVLLRYRFGPVHADLSRRQHMANVLFPSSIYGLYRRWRSQRARMADADPEGHEAEMGRIEERARARGDPYRNPRCNEDLSLVGDAPGVTLRPQNDASRYTPPPFLSRPRPRPSRELPSPPTAPDATLLNSPGGRELQNLAHPLMPLPYDKVSKQVQGELEGLADGEAGAAGGATQRDPEAETGDDRCPPPPNTTPKPRRPDRRN